MDLQRRLLAVALGIDVTVEIVAGQTPVHNLDGRDLVDTMTQCRIDTRRFRVDYDLPHTRRVRSELRGRAGVCNAEVGQLVGPFIAIVPCVSLHPDPLDVVPRRKLVELAPEIHILDGLLVRGPPAVLLPSVYPLADAELHVLRIGVEPHAARS